MTPLHTDITQTFMYFHTPSIEGKGQELSKSLETGTKVQEMYIQMEEWVA